MSLVMSGVLEERQHLSIQFKKLREISGAWLAEGEQFRVNLYAIVVKPHRRALSLSNIVIWFLIVFYCNRGWKKFRTFIASTFGIEPSSSTDANDWITAIKIKLESLSLFVKVKNPHFQFL